MNVKPAREEDLAELLQMVTEYQEEYEDVAVTEEQALSKYLTALLADEQRGAVFIGRTTSGGHPIGFASIYLCPSTRSAAFVPTIIDLYVRADYREKGFGRQLFDYAIKWAKAKKLPRLVCYCF